MSPTAWGAEIHADATPRWPTGTWSEPDDREDPADADADHRGLHAEQQQSGGERQGTAEDPGPAPPEARGGAIRERAGEGVGDERERPRDARDDAERDDALDPVAANTAELVDLSGQQQLNGGELRHPDAEPGDGEPGDPSAGHASGGFVEDAEGGWGRDGHWGS
jgi:hypothetical protein